MSLLRRLQFQWLKSQGEKVIADEPLVELETDKVNVEVPAPSNGILGSIAVKEGETVNVGSLLGTINDNSNQNKETKEIKNYNPPKKETKKKKITKKIDKKKIEEPVLKLDVESEQKNQEPLILSKIHKEEKEKKVIYKDKELKYPQLQEKWQARQKLILKILRELVKMD